MRNYTAFSIAAKYFCILENDYWLWLSFIDIEEYLIERFNDKILDGCYVYI